MSSSGISSLGAGNLAGIIVGGVLAVATIIGIALSCYSLCCKKKNPPQVNPYPPQNYQQNAYGRPMNTGYYGGQPSYPPQQQSWGSPPENDPREKSRGPPPSNYQREQPRGPPPPSYQREQSRGPPPPSYGQDQSWGSPPVNQPEQYSYNAPNTKY